MGVMFNNKKCFPDLELKIENMQESRVIQKTRVMQDQSRETN